MHDIYCDDLTSSVFYKKGNRIFGTVMPGATLGFDVTVGRNALVESDVVIGNDVSIQADAYITNGTVIEDHVFVGPGVVTTNDPYLGRRPDAALTGPRLKRGCAIGANATILPAVTIGEYATIGAGSVVTKDVPGGETWFGNPARRR